jgi:hypothetical protein
MGDTGRSAIEKLLGKTSESDGSFHERMVNFKEKK